MPNFSLVFAPELGIDAQSFADFWNNNPESIKQAVAQVQNVRGMATYDVPVWAVAALFFVGGMAADIAKDVITNYITEYLQQTLKEDPSCNLEFELIETKTDSGDKSMMLIVITGTH